MVILNGYMIKQTIVWVIMANITGRLEGIVQEHGEKR